MLQQFGSVVRVWSWRLKFKSASQLGWVGLGWVEMGRGKSKSDYIELTYPRQDERLDGGGVESCASPGSTIVVKHDEHLR